MTEREQKEDWCCDHATCRNIVWSLINFLAAVHNTCCMFCVIAANPRVTPGEPYSNSLFKAINRQQSIVKYEHSNWRKNTKFRSTQDDLERFGTGTITVDAPSETIFHAVGNLLYLLSHNASLFFNSRQPRRDEQ